MGNLDQSPLRDICKCSGDPQWGNNFGNVSLGILEAFWEGLPNALDKKSLFKACCRSYKPFPAVSGGSF